MNTPQNGPWAFPTHNAFGNDQGMLLRDYFAAAAMQGMIVCHRDPSEKNAIAIRAYASADAMLKAREAPSALEE